MRAATARTRVARLAAAALATVLTASSAAAERGASEVGGAARPAAAQPRGALELGGQLLVSGGRPRSRAGLAVTAYLGRRLGVRAAVGLVTLDPFGDAGLATVGIAYRAAAARPRLEIVVRGEAGLTWPAAPALGGGATTYLWPLRAPVAVTLDLGAVVILDGLEDSRLAVSLGLGLALAR